MISPAWACVIRRFSITSAIFETSLALTSSSSAFARPRSAKTLPEPSRPSGVAVVRLLFRLILLPPVSVDEMLSHIPARKQLRDHGTARRLLPLSPQGLDARYCHMRGENIFSFADHKNNIRQTK